MAKLLIVDDEPNVLYSFEKGIRQGNQSLEILTVETGSEALDLVERERPDAVILDVRLPDMSGLDVFAQLRKDDPRLPVIIVTAHSTTDTAIDAMKRGAFDYLLKPADIRQLCDLVDKALELRRLQHVPALFDDDSANLPSDRIVGKAPVMQEVYKMIGRVAAEDVTVLLLGESGTGKELVARAIYYHSLRKQKPFLAINCAALPEMLLESELFGHERGAFTGADRPRIGKFEQAHGGTLFLDELGDMSVATQAKVLRVLQDGTFERVGGNETIQTDVRVIAATNHNLEARIDSGEFRGDLLYRLNGFTICLPALRERMEDLPLLIEHAMKLSNQELKKHVTRLTPQAMSALESYAWPGNVRELVSAIKYAVVHTVGDVITPDCLPDAFRGSQHAVTVANGDDSPNELSDVTELIRVLLQSDQNDLYRCLMTRVDRVLLREVMKHVGGNQVHASQRLGVSRTTLRTKLASLPSADQIT